MQGEEIALNFVSNNVLGMRVEATSYDDASRRVVRWAQQGRAAYVCSQRPHGDRDGLVTTYHWIESELKTAGQVPEPA